jgi:tRNA A-37 threonylcarbamoyl transferase component Bud32
MAMPRDDPFGNTVALPAGQGAEEIDPRVGQVLGDRYRIVERIGQGGMGTVYAAEHLTTHKRCAIKTLLPDLVRSTEIVRRFEREAKAASLLAHPNVVCVTDFGALPDGGLFFAMELVGGQSLSELLEQAPLPRPRALRIARQILDALAHAHGQGVVHRDLKPDNVMIVDVGESAEERDLVKLLDFGIAKVVGEAAAGLGGDPLTRAGVAFGTPVYMAPEQALGEPVDARVDLYAMGVILFEMLAGRKPFVNDDKLAVLRMQVAVPPPRLSDAAPHLTFTPAMERTVAKALAKARQERFASAADMLGSVEELDRELGGQGRASVAGGVRAATPSLSTAAPDQRRRAIQVSIASVLGLVLVVFVGARQCASSGERPTATLAGALPRSALAARAEARLLDGDVEGALGLLEGELAGTAEQDPHAQLVYGHARAAREDDALALSAYERALTLAPALGRDETLRQNLQAMLSKKDRVLALRALDLLGSRVGDRADYVLVEQASRGKVRELRWRARDLADGKGLMARVDRVQSYALDLEQGAACKDRREAIPKLRALGDPRAIAPLKKARHRKGGLLGLESVNGCLESEAQEAIEFLEAR